MTFSDKFYQNFIQDGRFTYLTDGLKNTIIITIFAVILGTAIGVLVAIICSTYAKNGKLKVLNSICQIYLTVFRGTPVMVQLLIMFYVVLASSNNKLLVAILTFGINSGAYVAEIMRSGIMSIDNGQFEAGRSLGFNYVQTMRYIIIPQAFKNVLPALMNEFIAVLKETSVCGYIGMMDLTKGGDIIRSRTYEAFFPLMAVAIVYLIMVCGLSAVAKIVERRLRIGE